VQQLRPGWHSFSSCFLAFLGGLRFYIFLRRNKSIPNCDNPAFQSLECGDSSLVLDALRICGQRRQNFVSLFFV